MIDEKTSYNIAVCYLPNLDKHCLMISDRHTGKYLNQEQLEEWVQYVGGSEFIRYKGGSRWA
jgi:hypothetical protein